MKYMDKPLLLHLPALQAPQYCLLCPLRLLFCHICQPKNKNKQQQQQQRKQHQQQQQQEQQQEQQEQKEQQGRRSKEVQVNLRNW